MSTIVGLVFPKAEKSEKPVTEEITGDEVTEEAEKPAKKKTKKEE